MSHKQEEYEKSQLYRIRHSAAHVMAEAVLEMFPDGQVAIGPAIEEMAANEHLDAHKNAVTIRLKAINK